MNPLPEISAAVPGLMEETARWPEPRRAAEAEQAADVIASAADKLWRDTEPKASRKAPPGYVPEPTRGEVVRACALGIAILAHGPDGVNVAGRHWCTGGHTDCPGPVLSSAAYFDDHPSAGGGAVFTPRWLAEEVNDGALEALVYKPGPLQTADETAWRLRGVEEILALTTADITVGSGVFLLAACRYLAARLREAWLRDRGEDLGEVRARRMVAESCLHGADIAPVEVELTKVTLWLLTRVPGEPHVALSLVVGDSLLGITSLDQLAWMHLWPDRGREVQSPIVVAPTRRLAGCIHLANRLVRDAAEGVERDTLTLVRDTLCQAAMRFADLMVGAGLAAGEGGRQGNAWEKAYDALAVEAAQLAHASLTSPRSPVAYLMGRLEQFAGVDTSSTTAEPAPKAGEFEQADLFGEAS